MPRTSTPCMQQVGWNGSQTYVQICGCSIGSNLVVREGTQCVRTMDVIYYQVIDNAASATKACERVRQRAPGGEDQDLYSAFPASSLTSLSLLPPTHSSKRSILLALSYDIY